MKTSTRILALGVVMAALSIAFSTQASARHFRQTDAPAIRTVEVQFAPMTSVFGSFNTSAPKFLGLLRAPAIADQEELLFAFDGGRHGRPGDGDDDSSDGDDTIRPPHDGDTSHHHGGPGRPAGDDDSTGLGDGDTSHCPGHGGPHDSTDFGDRDLAMATIQ
jgi:hypothetical protein